MANLTVEREESTCIETISYNQATREMDVVFSSGSQYRYSFVGPHTVKRLMSADSLGGTFHQLIKKYPNKYPYVKVS